PAADFNGVDSFTYHMNLIPQDVGLVTIKVLPVNDAPVAVPDTLATTEDTPLIIFPNDLLRNDHDVDGDQFQVIQMTNPAHGLLHSLGNGTLVYTPFANYHGTDSFVYKASDGQLSSNPVAVFIDVLSVTDAPVLQPIGAKTVQRNTQLSFAVVGSDVDGPASDLTYSLGAAPVGASINAQTGVFSWTPQAIEGASVGPHDIVVRVTERGLPAMTTEQHFTVTVTALPDPGNGYASRLQVANALSHSAEFYSNFVTAAYNRFLGRPPEAAGL